jgi:Flp pilus assembly protein TadG
MARLNNGKGTRSSRRAREGNVAIITTLMLTVMMGFVALSFDIGNVYRVRTESQSAVDSAALAGASALDGTSAGIMAAKARAIDFGNRHHSYDNNVALTNGDIVPGVWDVVNGGFTVGGDNDKINAIQVTYNVASVAMPFASALGKSSMPVKASAIAIGGGPADNACGFPMVLPDCAVQAAVANNSCTMCLKMADANDDTAGWTTFGDNNGASFIAAAIVTACFDNGLPSVDPETGKCNGACSNRPKVGDPQIKVNGGNFFNGKGCDQIQAVLNRDGAPKPFTVEVPVIHVDPKGDCGGGKLNGHFDIAGATLLDIYGASCGGGPNPKQVIVQGPDVPACAAPGGNFLLATLHQDPVTKRCDGTPTHDHAGGGFFGVSGEPRLVK